MQKKYRKELVQLDEIFEELKKDAKDVAEDLTLGIEAIRTTGVFAILIGVLAAVMTYPSATLSIWISLVFAAFAGAMIALGAFTLRNYAALAKKYAKLLKLKRSR